MSKAPTTAPETLEFLKSLSDPRMVESWRSLGMPADNYLGVNLSRLKALAKTMDRNHVLAQELWGTGVHDARVLATLIEEPLKVPTGQLDRWLAESGYLDLADKVVVHVAARTLYAREKMKEWMASRKEYVRRAGYVLLCELMKTRKFPSVSDIEDVLRTIKRDLRKERDWVKEAMNQAVIAVGIARADLRPLALQTARTMGKVELDYGYSASRAPDAVERLSGAGRRSRRGRPPKATAPAPASGRSGVKRPRGRPPKGAGVPTTGRRRGARATS